MSATITHDFEELLHRRAAELAAFLNASATASVATADDPHEMLDFKDVAAEETRAIVDGVAIEQAARELSLVRDALRRLDDGTYGYCEDCGDPIDEARLAAMPATHYCTACQAVNEKRRPVRR